MPVPVLRGTFLIGVLLWAAPVAAQQPSDDDAPSPGIGQLSGPSAVDPGVDPLLAPIEAVSGILVLNQERLLAQSEYGQRVGREVEAASTALAAENRRIEAQLTAEELALTEQRQTMEPAAFRALAQEFDTRVEGIRTAQEAKGRSIQTQSEAARTRFFELAFPILLTIVEARGAEVLLDSRSVLLVADTVDITDAAIEAINAELGAGSTDPLIDSTGERSPEPRP